MMPARATADSGPRALDAGDLERVIAIDGAHAGHTRRRFFEKRFAVAAAHPEDFVHVGVMRGGALRGFAFARLLRGEFGREQVTAVLDAIGVERASRDLGIGEVLIEGLIETLRARGVRSLHSQVDWTNHALLQFFEACGFELAPRTVLERAVAEPLAERGVDA